MARALALGGIGRRAATDRPSRGARERGPVAPALAALLCVAIATGAAPVSARPQITAGLTIGGGARVAPSDRSDARFHLGLHTDVLLGRDDPWDFGLGPYLELLSQDFDSLETGLGATLLLPVHDTFPLLVSAGGAWAVREGADCAILTTRIAWGSRSYNYHAVYGLAALVWASARAALDGSSFEVLGGVQLDLAVLVLPFVGLYTWITGTDPDEPEG